MEQDAKIGAGGVNGLRLLTPLLPLVIPLAARWVRGHEADLSVNGTPLTAAQMEDARQAGVLHPEKIRLGFVRAIPMPGDFLLGDLGRLTGLINANTAGITLGYGIYIRNDFQGDRGLYVHEFVHVGQYERFGSIEKFLRSYLGECLHPGYPWGPLEQEAIHRAHDIVGEA